MANITVSENPLAAYLDGGSGRAADLARSCGVSPQAVDKWKRRVPAERVRQIVEATDRALSAHDLRPDLYHDGFEFPASEAA